METRNFIGYEYKDVTVENEMESLYADGYENFGWQLDERSGVIPGISYTTLKFKRDRKTLNKAELTRLQRQFDACVSEITALEKSKTSSAMIISLVIGVIGCAFMAGSVFAITAAAPAVILCAILAVPGFICWALPYFVYKSQVVKRGKKVTPLIEAKYDEIYETCEKANNLMHV